MRQTTLTDNKKRHLLLILYFVMEVDMRKAGLGQTDSELKYNIHPDRDFDLNNVASSTELTGLIPFAVYSNDENESYSELMEYQPQDITLKKMNSRTINIG